MLLLAVFLAGQAATPATVTAAEAMSSYRRMTTTGQPGWAGCAPARAEDIMVCGRGAHAAPRLPLPDERFKPGAVVRHPSEPPARRAAFQGGPTEPGRLMETLAKGIGLLKGVVTGEDPN